MRGNNLRRYINQNRIKIIGISLFVIMIILVIRVVNMISEQTNDESSKLGNTLETRNISSNYTQNYFVQSNEQIPETTTKENKDIIEEFFLYCNQGQVQPAYELLTQECKEIFYPTIDYFINNYYKPIFNKPKSYHSQSWMAKDNFYTYKIEIIDDLLATGGVNKSPITEDYITIVKGKDKDRLNINGYVGNKRINESVTVNGITISVQKENIFIDYNSYVINVKNETNKTILLDSRQSTKTVYLTDKNETTYSSFIYEVDNISLQIKPKISKSITVKFNKAFNKDRDIQKISFTDIIMDLDAYEKVSNKKEYENRLRIDIGI